jgi:rubrerythrin
VSRAPNLFTEGRAMAIVWKCLVCGYHQQDDQPPEHCPNCGAPKEEFVLVEED